MKVLCERNRRAIVQLLEHSNRCPNSADNSVPASHLESLCDDAAATAAEAVIGKVQRCQSPVDLTSEQMMKLSHQHTPTHTNTYTNTSKINKPTHQREHSNTPTHLQALCKRHRTRAAELVVGHIELGQCAIDLLHTAGSRVPTVCPAR